MNSENSSKNLKIKIRPKNLFVCHVSLKSNFVSLLSTLFTLQTKNNIDTSVKRTVEMRCLQWSVQRTSDVSPKWYTIYLFSSVHKYDDVIRLVSFHFLYYNVLQMTVHVICAGSFFNQMWAVWYFQITCRYSWFSGISVRLTIAFMHDSDKQIYHQASLLKCNLQIFSWTNSPGSREMKRIPAWKEHEGARCLRKLIANEDWWWILSVCCTYSEGL